MEPGLTLAAIPQVLEDDELPFVLGLGADTRRSLEVGGAAYRRGTDRCTIDWRLEGIGLRATLIESGGNCYLMASTGPLLTDWWPLLEREGGNPARPLLTAALTGAQQKFETTVGDQPLSVIVSIVRPSPPEIDATTAVAGFEGRLRDEVLFGAHLQSLGVIKAALLVFSEYRSLGTVPDVDVSAEGTAVPLATVLDVAQSAADAVNWTRSAG